MYVGITRARQKLYLTHALMRYRYGESTHSIRSRFLDEIDGTLLTPERSLGARILMQTARAGAAVCGCPVFTGTRPPAQGTPGKSLRPDARLRERVTGIPAPAGRRPRHPRGIRQGQDCGAGGERGGCAGDSGL